MALFVALVFQLMIEANLKVNNCQKSKGAANITKLEISGCTNYPCLLRKNTNSTIKLGLHFSKKVNDLKLRIAGVINGRDIPFNVNDKDHCVQTVKTTKNCTINRNSTHKYEFSLPVLKEYPTLMVLVRYEIIDSKKNPVACFTFPARIDN
jgi:Niemann-Pick C2 protein